MQTPRELHGESQGLVYKGFGEADSKSGEANFKSGKNEVLEDGYINLTVLFKYNVRSLSTAPRYYSRVQ